MLRKQKKEVDIRMHLTFGFSYLGFLFLLMLIIPNIIWSKKKPKDYDKYVKNENKILMLLERIGEILVTCLSLFFNNFNIDKVSCVFLLLAFLIMILYEIYWIRYFKSEKTMKDMYSSLFKIPLPGATLPIIAFLLLGVSCKNTILLLATILLGIGHIGIHFQHQKEIEINNNSK